jgi:hypothetical protein
MRSIQVNLDRKKFTINPTNCAALSIDSQGIGDQGTIADFSSYFHAVNCGTLGFQPRMTMRQLGGHKQTQRSQNPAIEFKLTTRKGDANIKSVALTLPQAFEIDQAHLGGICSKSQLEKTQCAGSRAIGQAKTKTPLLDAPLSGPAYAVSGFGKLPHVVFLLNGQVPLRPEVVSKSVKGGHLKAMVQTVPDAPIGTFTLKLFGGKIGYLVNTRNLCASPTKTKVDFVAQNGKTLTEQVALKTNCG